MGLVLAAWPALAERINQEGRILGPAPVVTNAVLFNTAQADTILSAMQILPVTHPWNEDISRRPVLTNSAAMIAQIMSDLNTNNWTLRAFYEMNFVLIPDNQPLLPISFLVYPGDSDPGPYPIPTNMPVETWPKDVSPAGTTLLQWQQDFYNKGGDRHASIMQPGAGYLWEMWQAKLTNGNWTASNGAKFDMNTGATREEGLTSGDAAGLQMFPSLPRYDECERGVVEHACRIVVGRSRKEYIYPATHWASSTSATQTNVPAMGQRVRLKASFSIPSGWAKEEKAILVALKKYGALVADNGSFFSISVTPDDRWPANAFSHISSVSITNFEVIQTTATNGGPRSAGAPTANAGADRVVGLGQPVTLQGNVNYTSAPPLTVRWYTYSGPGTNGATFANTALTNTTATFTNVGTYTLMLSASNGLHAIAYDAMVVTVTNSLLLSAAKSGTNLNLSWIGGTAPFVVERTSTLAPPAWSPLATTAQQNASTPITASNRYFRVRGQ